MEILVFKTNIHQTADVQLVSQKLLLCNDIETWNVDLEDVDKVLRIVARNDISEQVEQVIAEAGYLCSELV